jgi:hypothetical protein
MGDTTLCDTGTNMVAGPALRDAAHSSDFVHLQLANISRNFAHEKQDGNVIPNWLINWVDGSAVILSTCAAAWAAGFFLTVHEDMEQFIPDIIAVLAFFVTLRLR